MEVRNEKLENEVRSWNISHFPHQNLDSHISLLISPTTMKQIDFLIIGGSAAGTTAAEVIRSLNPESSITIVTDENHEEYSRVLLPHYIRGKVSREQVFLKKPDWYSQNKIELLKKTKAVGIDPQNHLVDFDSGEQYQYRKLLIAVGGKVIRYVAGGAELANILYMRTIEDADAIVRAAKAASAKATAAKGVIIGGGFIGLEFTSCLKINGVSEVTVLVMEDYYWQGKLDRDSGQVLANTLERNGVKILVNEQVAEFRGSPLTVVTKSGKTFEADVVGIGIGIKSDLEWLRSSGIKINRAIMTNEYLETNLADVYAAGDCAEFHDVIFGRQHIMGNWANATSQGLAVGKTMTGERTIFETASSYSINYFDGACSFIGVTDDKFADQIIVRGSVENYKMTRIFIKTIDGVMRVVGATVINDPSQVSPLTMAVKNKVGVSEYKEKLTDQSFDLKELLF